MDIQSKSSFPGEMKVIVSKIALGLKVRPLATSEPLTAEQIGWYLYHTRNASQIILESSLMGYALMNLIYGGIKEVVPRPMAVLDPVTLYTRLRKNIKGLLAPDNPGISDVQVQMLSQFFLSFMAELGIVSKSIGIAHVTKYERILPSKIEDITADMNCWAFSRIYTSKITASVKGKMITASMIQDLWLKHVDHIHQCYVSASSSSQKLRRALVCVKMWEEGDLSAEARQILDDSRAFASILDVANFHYMADQWIAPEESTTFDFLLSSSLASVQEYLAWGEGEFKLMSADEFASLFTVQKYVYAGRSHFNAAYMARGPLKAPIFYLRTVTKGSHGGGMIRLAPAGFAGAALQEWLESYLRNADPDWILSMVKSLGSSLEDDFVMVDHLDHDEAWILAMCKYVCMMPSSGFEAMTFRAEPDGRISDEVVKRHAPSSLLGEVRSTNPKIMHLFSSFSSMATAYSYRMQTVEEHMGNTVFVAATAITTPMSNPLDIAFYKSSPNGVGPAVSRSQVPPSELFTGRDIATDTAMHLLTGPVLPDYLNEVHSLLNSIRAMSATRSDWEAIIDIEIANMVRKSIAEGPLVRAVMAHHPDPRISKLHVDTLEAASAVVRTVIETHLALLRVVGLTDEHAHSLATIISDMEAPYQNMVSRALLEKRMLKGTSNAN